MDGATGYLDGVDDTFADEVNELTGHDIVAIVGVVLFLLDAANGINDNRTFFAGVTGEDTHGLFEGPAQDADTKDFVFVSDFDVVKGGNGVDQGNTTTGNDTFFDSCACS